MPKENVDYSNTIIYKIYCKDETITDLYVGHTTNFIQRKYAHKMACNKNKYGVKIYNVIQANGGWDNWNMVEIARYNCKDSTEARIKEQEHYNMLKASLNSCYPFVDKANYFCNICNLHCQNPATYTKHIKCGLHLKKKSNAEIGKIEVSTTLPRFFCDVCDFKCYQKCDWDRHISTKKHLNIVNGNIKENLEIKKPDTDYFCKCGKTFKTNSGLWKHNKICKNTPENEQLSEIKEKLNGIDKDELIMMILKQNAQLIEQNNSLMEIFKKVESI